MDPCRSSGELNKQLKIVNNILEFSLVFEHIVVNSDDKNLVKLNQRTIIVKCKVRTLERSVDIYEK